MRKNDQILIWEAFEGSISPGGPLGGGSKSSSSGHSSGNDSEESNAPGLMGLLAQVLQGVEDGSIDESEACEHLSMILGGESEATEDEDEDCMSGDEEDEDYEEDEDGEDYMEDDEEDSDENAPAKKLDFSSKKKHEVRKGFPEEKGVKNFRRPHNVPVHKRRTTDPQEGI